MADFDPKAYADSVEKAQDFDPKAYADAVADAPQKLEPAKPVTLGAGDTFLMHGARHLAFGLGDKIAALEETIGDKLHDKHGKVDFWKRYRTNLAFNDQLLEDSDKAHPAERWAGNALGVLGGTAATLGVGAAGRALGLAPAAERAAAPGLARVLQGAKEGAKTGAALGAVGGFGGSRSDSALGTAVDSGVGGLFGSALGGALGALGGGASSWLARRAAARTVPAQVPEAAPGVPSPAPAAPGAPPAALEPIEPPKGLPSLARAVKPTKEAQVLQARGIPLTLGQMDPGSMPSEAEEAAARIPLLGKAIERQRHAAEEAWQHAVVNETRPIPGALGPGDASEQLARIKDEFRIAYGSIAEKPVPPAAVHPETGKLVNPHEAFGAILQDPNYQAGDQDLRIVSGVMKDQLSKLDRASAPGEGVTAKLLMDMRSHLRDAAQTARMAGEYARSQMFQDAADAVGGGIKAGLSPADQELLAQTDAAYSRFLRVSDTVSRASDSPHGFKPSQLVGALKKAYGRKFAEDPNAGGSLRELARAGRAVFEPRGVKTGHGELAHVPFAYGAAPLVYRANASPAAQAAFLEASRHAVEGRPQMTLPPAASELEQLFTRHVLASPAGTPGGAAAAQAAIAAALERNRSQ